MNEKFAKAIAGTERSIEVLQALMALLIDNISKEIDDEALDEPNMVIMEAAEDMQGQPFTIRFPVYSVEGDEILRRVLTVSFSVAIGDRSD